MNSTLIRPILGLAALVATIPLIAMLPRTLGILFGLGENGWVALATFAALWSSCHKTTRLRGAANQSG
jgi:hypothetical protein